MSQFTSRGLGVPTSQERTHLSTCWELIGGAKKFSERSSLAELFGFAWGYWNAFQSPRTCWNLICDAKTDKRFPQTSTRLNLINDGT